MNTITLHHTASRVETLTTGTVGELVQWLESYISLVHPNCGIEYWSDLTFDHNSRKLADVLVGFQGDLQPACCAVRGHSEGVLVRVTVAKDHRIEHLGFAKMFCTMQQAWEVAATISEVLTQILIDGTQPTIVDMARAFPGMSRWTGSQQPRPQVVYPIEACVITGAATPTIVVTDASGSEVLECHVAGGRSHAAGLNAILKDLQRIRDAFEMDLHLHVPRNEHLYPRVA